MLKHTFFVIPGLIFCFLSAGAAPDDAGNSFSVEPDTLYSLSFVPKNGEGEKNTRPEVRESWEIVIRNADGSVSGVYGLLNAPWQEIPSSSVSGGKDSASAAPVRHRFRTSPEAVSAEVRFLRNGKESASAGMVRDLKLEKVADENLAESGASFAGPGDFCGFDETSQAEIVLKDGKYVLKTAPRGYALSNFIPVVPGETYRLGPEKRSHTRPFLYDADYRFLKVGSMGATFTAPEKVAFVRFFFGGNAEVSGLTMTRSGKKKDPAQTTQGTVSPKAAPAGSATASVPEKNLNAGTVKDAGVAEVAEGKKKGRGTPAPDAAEKVAKGGTGGDTPLYLVRNSLPAAEIIVGGSAADPRELFAACELRYWLGVVGNGAKLPVLSEASRGKKTRIFIGKSFAEKLFPEDLKKLKGTEGFAFRRKGNDIYLFGDSPKGTLFGTWRFLENNTDLIWSRPHEEYGAVYEIQPDIAVSDCDRLDIPVFKLRSWSMPGGVDDGEITNLYYARNGANPMLTVNGFAPMHYLGKLYCRSLRVGGGFMYGYLGKYKDTHPEFFPLTDGRRKLSNHAQPCFTNPEAVKAVIREARIHLAQAPDETLYLDCGNEDTWTCCECESCLAPIRLEDGTLLKPKSKFSDKDPLFRSTQLYQFLNQVAEALEKDYPDTKIVTLAYIFSAEPPAVKVHHNILSLYAPYPTHNARFPLRDSHSRGTANSSTWAERFKKWGEGGSPLAFYEYLGNAYFNAAADATAENLRDLKKYGGWGMNSEALQEFDKNLYGIGNFKQMWDVNSLNMWVITRLMWNPDQDVNQLRREFIRRSYRGAAPWMEKFYEIIIRNWNNPAVRSVENCHSGRSGVFKRYIVDPGNEKEARALLVEAEKNADNPHSRLLIRDILKSFDEWASSLGRIRAPFVSESSEEAFDFTSPHWEKAQVLQDFFLPRQYGVKAEDRVRASDPSELRIMRDGENLYFKFRAFFPEKEGIRLTEKSDSEIFPYGEHAEIQLRVKGALYLFAFDANGNVYDAKNWDRSWNSSGRKIKARKDGNSWEAVLSVPLKDLGFDLKKDAARPPELVLSRIRAGKQSGKQEESTYKGVAPNGEHIWSPLMMMD